MATFSLLMLAIALGSMVFFSFAVTPLVFAKLDKDKAGGLIRDLFSVYYPFLTLTTAAAGVCIPWGWSSAVLCVVAIGFVLALFVLTPAINRLRDKQMHGDDEAGRRFKRLHRIGMAVNLMQIAVLTLVLATTIDGLIA